MPRNARAIVFDLDDTLYPYRRFVRSGFAAVARYLARADGLDAHRIFRMLVRASRRGERGVELQACLLALGADLHRLPTLLEVFRHHQPTLVLPVRVASTLAVLRSRGWRLGVLTNGWPDVQARKVAALDLASRVDAIVFATAHGPGKPHPGAFAGVLRRLDVSPPGAVFVGDDEACDVRGARNAGLAAIRLTQWRSLEGPSAAHATVSRWADIAGAAEQVMGVTRSHAA